MGLFLLAARLTLAGVFGLAGIAKLLDLQGVRKAITDFGAPKWLADPLGYGLPFFEILIAILLLPVPTAVWGALGALVLLVTFTVVITVNMAQGKRPDCHCFGQLHSKPIGISTLFRNLLLAVGAAGVVWLPSQQPALSVSAAMNMLFAGQTSIAVLAGGLALIVVAHAYLTLHLFRQNGRLLLRIEALESASGRLPQSVGATRSGLPVGSVAPKFELPLAGGGMFSLDGLLNMGKQILLVFSDAACGPCKALIPELVVWQRQHSEILTLVVVTRGVSKEKPSGGIDLDYVLVQNDREVAEAYQVMGTPSAVLIGKDGLLGSFLASGANAIGNLVNAAANGNLPTMPASLSAPRPIRVAPRIGSPAPQFTLPDLSGRAVRLADMHGHQTLLLFWNPSCGFCARMLPRLKEWEAARARSAPQVVLISTGTLEMNKAMGLRALVLLDQGHGTLGLFGANGTPSALLLDPAGNIGSSLAMGADAIWGLMNSQASTFANENEPVLGQI